MSKFRRHKPDKARADLFGKWAQLVQGWPTKMLHERMLHSTGHKAISECSNDEIRKFLRDNGVDPEATAS